MLKTVATNAKKNHAPRAIKTPSYRERAPYGQAIVTLTDSHTKQRRDYWLGAMNSPESWELYHRVCALWMSNGRRLPEVPGTNGRFTAGSLTSTMGAQTESTLTINELIRDYWKWAKDYYQPQGTHALKSSLRILRKLFGSLPAAEFGPNRLRLVRDEMVRGDPEADPPRVPWARSNVNGQVHKLCAMFKWAAGQEKLPVAVFHQLKTVPALKRGKSKARETERVKPVGMTLVDAVRPLVSRQVRALIDLQLLTGARGGELFKLRPQDIKTNEHDGVWQVTLTDHKSAHHGHTRIIYMGPKAKAVVAPFLKNRPSNAYLFSPAEAEQERLAARNAKRTTPLSCGNRPGPNKLEQRQRPPKPYFTAAAYRRAVERACRKAFPCPAGLTLVEQREWLDRHHWHPHQLRHLAGTLIRKEFGLEAAKVVLGHSSAVVTDAVYAERDMDKVAEIMKSIG